MSTNAFNLQLAVEGEPSCASAAPSTSLSRFAQELHRLHIPKHTFPQDDGDSAAALDHFFNADDAEDKYYNQGSSSSSSRQTAAKFAPASLLCRETSMTSLCHSTDADVIIPGSSSSQTFSPSSRFAFSNSPNFPKSEPLPCRRQTQTQSASSPRTVDNSVETPIMEQREADDADDTFDDSVDEIGGPGEQPPSSGRWRLWNGRGGRRNSSTASFSSKNITANNLKTPTFSSKNVTANYLKTSTFSRSNMSRLCHSQPSSPVGVRAHEALHPTVFNSGPLLMPFGGDGESPFVVPRSFLEFGQDVVVDESPTSAAARTSRNRRGNYGMFRTSGLSSRSPRTSFDIHAESSWRKCEEGHAVVAPREVEVSEDQQPSAKDVSAGRFFDALKGPELETPKVWIKWRFNPFRGWPKCFGVVFEFFWDFSEIFFV